MIKGVYRVKSEVKPLQAFSCLAFPFLHTRKTALKQAIFGDELVTSFVWIGNENPHFVQIGFRHSPGIRLGLHLGAILVAVSKENNFDAPAV